MTRYCAGIDLGTTNTVLSVWRHGAAGPQILPIRQPVEDATAEGSRALPLLDSVVTLLDGRAYVGAFARQIALLREARTFMSIKRYMGRHWYRTHDGVGWTPERVSACILKVVQQQLAREYGGPPERLVVTIPASFGSEARRATLAAACLAGFDPDSISLFDEPTAALLAELRENDPHRATSERDLHAVVDIGGGTLDVSLVRMQREAEQTVFDVVGQSRYNEIAGDDFDLNIAGLLLHRFELDNGKLRQLLGSDSERVLLSWLLLQKARDVKHRLSRVLSNQPPSRWASIREAVVLSEIPEVGEWRVELSGFDLVDALREYFPAVDDPDARRSEFGFFRPIQECLDAASVHDGVQHVPFDVDHVWMVGGSASLPPVALALRHIFGRSPTMIRDPMYAVARGAAWKAGIDAGYDASRFQVRDRVFDGVFLKTSRGAFLPIVPVRQEVPMPRMEYADIAELSRPDNRVVIELYTGAQPEEGDTAPELSPLARRIVTFPDILPRGTRISLAAEMTSDRQLRLEFSADVAHGALGVVSVGTAPGFDDLGPGSGLPPINDEGGLA